MTSQFRLDPISNPISGWPSPLSLTYSHFPTRVAAKYPYSTTQEWVAASRPAQLYYLPDFLTFRLVTGGAPHENTYRIQVAFLEHLRLEEPVETLRKLISLATRVATYRVVNTELSQSA